MTLIRISLPWDVGEIGIVIELALFVDWKAVELPLTEDCPDRVVGLENWLIVVPEVELALEALTSETSILKLWK